METETGKQPKKLKEIKPTSEFGAGCSYCIGLFLMHSFKDYDEKSKEALGDRHPEMWFNGASDHLYEINVPDNFPPKLKNRIKRFQHKVLTWGHGFREPKPTQKDRVWAVNEAKRILMEIDKFIGTPKVIRGGYE